MRRWLCTYQKYEIQSHLIYKYYCQWIYMTCQPLPIEQQLLQSETCLISFSAPDQSCEAHKHMTQYQHTARGKCNIFSTEGGHNFIKATCWSVFLSVTLHSSSKALQHVGWKLTVSDGFTRSNTGLDIAPNAAAGSDLLTTRFPCEGQQGFKGETGAGGLSPGGRPAVPYTPSEGCMQGGGGVKWAHNSTSGKTPASGNGKMLF